MKSNPSQIRYSIPEGVHPLVSSHPLLANPQNGKVALDEKLMDLWRFADGRKLSEIIAGFDRRGVSPDHVRVALACLAEAGLLTRSIPPAPAQPLRPVVGRLVSVVIIAYNGKDWLKECLPSLMKQTYSPIEIIIVDNASTEPVENWIKAEYPGVKVISLERPHTIPAANNRGVAFAQGDYFLILNQDTRLEPDAVAEMVARIDSDPKCVEVAPKLRLYWAPAFLNGIGNRVLENSWGTDNAIGHLDLGQFDHWKEVPSACTAAALISRSGWEAVGGMDEKFPMYYDDPEWSYRARLFGYKVLAAPKAVIYHAFGGKVPKSEIEPLPPAKLRNAVYGRYRFTLKLLYRIRGKLLRNYVIEDWARFIDAIGQRNWPVAKAYINAWYKVLSEIMEIRREHRLVERQRIIPDDHLFALQAGYPDLATWNNLPELTWDRIGNQYYPLIRAKKTRPLPEFSPQFRFGKVQRRPRLLIVSHDVVSEKMGGPGARYAQIGRALSKDMDVTLAVPSETSLKIPAVRLVTYSEERPASLEVLVENHEIALISGYMPYKFPFLKFTCTRLVVDLYDPFFLENIYYYLDKPIDKQRYLNDTAIDVTNQLMRMGDFFICGTERQRDFWLGMMAASARVNPLNFVQDPSLRSLIDIVGVGFPSHSPERHSVVRGKIVPVDSKIVVWGGGIWNWLDPLTLVRAWPQIVSRHPDARLIFLGTRYPNPVVPVHKMAGDTIDLAKKIGEKDLSIHFIEWLSYQDHQALLGESDVGVTFQPEHIETHFSIRTRVIDYFWARLPVVVSEGDVTAEWVSRYNVGRVVPVFDVNAVAQAINEMLDTPKGIYLPAFEAMQDEFAWNNIVKPLRNYCLYGDYAPDRVRYRDYGATQGAPVGSGGRPTSPFARARQIAKEEGLLAMFRRGARHAVWLLTKN